MNVAAPFFFQGRTSHPAATKSTTSPWLAAFALTALACWAGWSIPLNNDVSWQYWIAHQMRGGATLYRDIVEVNPPLWFWEAVPISALADRLHVDAPHLVVVSVMIRVAFALVLMWRLSERRSGPRTLLVLTRAALLLAVLPLHDFAEREHLMLIGAVPYTVLLARRRDPARPVPAALAWSVGLFAAYGFAMKPHFALVPLALEAWLAIGLRRSWRPLRPETIALALVGTAYAIAVPLFAPDYLGIALPMVRLAYGALSPPASSLILDQLWTPVWIVAAIGLWRARADLPVEARAATVAALALVVIYVLQAKGFSNHALPVTAMLGWALWCTLARDAAMRHPFAAFAMVALVATGLLLGAFSPARAGRATAALERLPPGSTVAVVSAHSWLAFPLVETHRFVWPLRTMSLWTVPKIARDGEGSGATRDGLLLRQRTLDMLATDLWCHPPDAILVDDPARSPALRGTRFSYEAFVRSDARLRRLFTHYRPLLSDAGVEVYARAGAITPSGTGCRRIVPRPDFD